MDLTSPLRSLIPSLDSAALEVLARTESALSATQVARLASRGSRPGLSLALDRLVEHGLVVAEPANRGFLYRFNRRHVLADAALSAMDARSRTLQLLTEAVERLDPEPLHVAVFGSFARGEGSWDSDLDLFILAPTDEVLHAATWRDQIQALEEQVLEWTGNRLEVLALSADTFASAVEAQEPIVGALLVEGIPLTGKPLGDLVPVSSPGVGRRR